MKIFKRMTVLLLTVMTLICLTSCKALDERKAVSAYWADEARTAISWQGNKYVASTLPGTINLDLSLSGGTVWVNEPDVPVLMSESEGTLFTTDEQHRVLFTQGTFYLEIFPSHQEDNDIYQSALYIREDLKDEIEKELEEAKTDHYCLELSLAEGNRTVLISEETAKLLDEVQKSGKKIPYEKLIEDDSLSEILYYCMDEITVYPCDASMLVRNGYMSIFYHEDEQGKAAALISWNEGSVTYYVPDTDLSVYRALDAFRKQAVSGE